MRVDLVESPKSVFPLGLDDVWFTVPDGVAFCPQIGHRLNANLLRHRTNAIVERLDVRIVDVAWILESNDPEDQNPRLVLTVSSEMPAKPTTRRPHLKK